MTKEESHESAAKKAEQIMLARHASRKNLDSSGTMHEPKEEKKKEKPKKVAPWKHALAGGIAGVAEVAGTMPLDVAKTRMQNFPGKYSNPIHCMKAMAAENGLKGLYFGFTPFALQTAGKASIRFTAFAQIKTALELIMGSENQKTISMIAGLASGMVEAMIWTTPTERIKVLKQVSGNRPEYGNIFSATKYIVQTQGVTGMFVGLIPTSIRQASSVGVRFALYPTVKQIFPENGGTLTHMAAGGTVGGLSVILNNPVDVIKSIQQSGKLNDAGKPMGMIECGKLVVKESGWSGFGRGLTARVPRVFCGQAITFAVYEQISFMLADV